MNKIINIALAGNPNSGKTTLFNAFTGTRQHVGNWPGVTVEKKEGKAKYKNDEVLVTDLPGTYSLSPYSIEEIVARDYIVEGNPDVVVNIVDASNIERNLYLSIQLIELGKPVVIALNMMDVVEKRSIQINVENLSESLGVPIVPIVASKNQGLDTLLDTSIRVAKGEIKYNPNPINYGDDLEKKIEETIKSIEGNPKSKKYGLRWLAIKVIEEDKAVLELLGLKASEETAAVNEFDYDEDYESMIADRRYEVISKTVTKSVKKPKKQGLTTSDKIDKVLTNKWWGLPIFAGMMYLVFALTFKIGNVLLDVIDGWFGTLGELAGASLEAAGIAGWLNSLIVDGIIGGVGGVLVFLPNIAFLFFAISILEDSGYMARVAFIMDRAMRKIGLNGKAFIPMIMGFGCSVPAIMATRTLEEEKDRIASILITPFMSCSARAPIYIMFIAAFFTSHQGLIMFSMYFIGIIVAIIMGLIFKNTLFKGKAAPFVMELPPYRIPTVKGTLLRVWDRVKAYIIRAGTIIFAASIVLWFVLNFNFTGMVEITESIGASIGRGFSLIFKPLGFGNWQASLSLITGIIAKEVVVSNMAIIYGLGEAVGEAAMEGDLGSFAPVLQSMFTQLSAFAFMVFSLLYTPCIAALGVIKRETNSWKWTAFSAIYQFVVAWIVTFLVYQIGGLFF